MGVFQHHAIIVTTWDEAAAIDAHHQADTLCQYVTEPVCTQINSFWSFAILPDGSKEGWEPSDHGDNMRAEFIEWLEGQDGRFDWVEVGFGEFGTTARGNN